MQIIERFNTFSDILEIWEYQCNIGKSDSKALPSETETVKQMFLDLKRELQHLKKIDS